MSEKEKVQREGFNHWLIIPTRWMDNDVYGHVNNVQYYSFFDTVINEYLINEGGLDIHTGEIIGLAVDGEHTRGFANAQHLLSRQLPMNIAGQRGQMADISHVEFLVQYRLIKVCNAPALRNVELEQIRKFLGCQSGHGITPCTKWDE